VPPQHGAWAFLGLPALGGIPMRPARIGMIELVGFLLVPAAVLIASTPVTSVAT